MPTTTLAQTAASVASATSNLGQTALTVYFSNLTILEVVSTFISLVLIIGIVLIIMQTGWLTSRVDRVRHVVLKTDMSKKHAADGWKKVQLHFFAGNDNDLKVAIMQADNILEEALRYAGVRGSNLGDRLKNLKRSQMPNLDDVWQAHKLRNQIAHQSDFSVKRDLAERTLSTYEKALQNLGVLNDE